MPYEQKRNKDAGTTPAESTVELPKSLAQVRREMSQKPLSQKEKSDPKAERVLQERFEKLLKGKFNRIPAGNFKTGDARLSSISFTRSQKTSEGTQTLYATIYYAGDKKEQHTTWTISPHGYITGPHPKDFPLNAAEVKNEILNIVERIGLDFWHATNIEILPFTDPDEPKELLDYETEQEKKEKRRIDLERIEFLENHPAAVFGIIDRSRGFNAYHAFLFPGFVLIEHPVVKNAAYLVPLENAPAVTHETVRQWSEDQREAYVERYIKPIFELATTKKRLREYGGIQIVHTPTSWKERMRNSIDGFLKEKS